MLSACAVATMSAVWGWMKLESGDVLVFCGGVGVVKRRRRTAQRVRAVVRSSGLVNSSARMSVGVVGGAVAAWASVSASAKRARWPSLRCAGARGMRLASARPTAERSERAAPSVREGLVGVAMESQRVSIRESVAKAQVRRWCAVWRMVWVCAAALAIWLRREDLPLPEGPAMSVMVPGVARLARARAAVM